MSRRLSIVSDSVIGESLIDEIFGEIKRTNSLRRDDFNGKIIIGQKRLMKDLT